MKRTTRAQLRGEPLDEDCKKANISRYEYGRSDNRCFCYGLWYEPGGPWYEKCEECGAFVGNAIPLKGDG